MTVGARQGRGLGQLDVDEKDALVFVGQKTGGPADEKEVGRENPAQTPPDHQHPPHQPAGAVT
jgi:hypothetical protein